MSATMTASLDDIEEAVLAQVHGSSISNTVMSSLLALFPQHLMQALDLIDRRRVTRIETDRRVIYQVGGSSGHTYLVLPNQNFCECASYGFAVLKSQDSMCKHVLAAKLATRLDGHLVVSKIDDYAMAQKLQPLDAY